MKKVLISLIALILTISFAQNSVFINPQSIVINPRPSFVAEVWVDKDPSGNSSPSYYIGENIQIGVRVSEDSYIYLFSVHSNGVIDQILPNNYDSAGQSNYLFANESRIFPHANATYNFSVDGPVGLDKVFVVASKTPLNTSQLANFENDPYFASSNLGQQNFAETLSIIVTPREQDSWVTDTAQFYVESGNSGGYLGYGNISISSSPSNASAYVDGQYVGYTPVDFSTIAGEHTVTVEWYDHSFVGTVSVYENQTAFINAD